MRKKLQFKVLLFLGLIVLSDIIFGKVINNYQHRALRGTAAKDNYISDSMNEDIIIMGSSRALHHYNPEVFDSVIGKSCFNAGSAGMGIILMYGRFLQFTKRYMPKYIIYDVNPHYDTQKNDNTRYLSLLRAHYDCVGVDSLIWNVSHSEKVKMYSNLYPFNSRILEMFSDYFSGETPLKRKGFEPYYGSMKYEPLLDKEKYSTDIDELKISYFEKLIKSSIGKTTLICVNSPRYGGQDEQGVKPIKDLCHKYDIPFWDYSNDKKYIWNKRYFKDKVHMNIEGANAFSLEITKRINELDIDEKGNN